MEGPVYLRSSANPLPDLVFALKGRGIEVDLAGKVDSVRGGIRGSFEAIPDAPVTKFLLTMFGGKHGALVNAGNLCASPQLATAKLIGHNNKGVLVHPEVQARCNGHGKHRKGEHAKKGRGGR